MAYICPVCKRELNTSFDYSGKPDISSCKCGYHYCWCNDKQCNYKDSKLPVMKGE
jgi:hypothetical protein